MRRAVTTGLLAASIVSATAQPPQTAEVPAAVEADQLESSSLYQVKDGDKVDEKTLQGWKTWRALACDRCHGPEQEGLVGPPLVESMKRLTKEEFHSVLMEGRPDKGMPPFNASPMVTANWEGLYAYLKGRSDGQIKAGRLSGLQSSDHVAGDK